MPRATTTGSPGTTSTTARTGKLVKPTKVSTKASTKGATTKASVKSPAKGSAAKGSAAKATTAKAATKPKASTAKAATKAKASTARASTAKASTAKASKAATGKASSATDRFLEAQRKELLAEREAYTRSADSLRAEADQLAQDREPGDVQFDEESGEGDSMNVERERDLALSAQALASIEEIDVALAKIDAGTYGTCEKCGAAIPRERLKALPHAALCVRCKSGGLGRR